MKRSACMAAAVLSLTAGVLGQSQPSGGAPDPSARDRLREESFRKQEETTRKQEEARAARLLTVNFAGGTIGQYVEALRKASTGGTANIVLSDRSSKVPISAINLKGVDVGVAVSAIPAAYSGARGVWHIEPVFPNGMPRMGTPDAATTTYSVDFETVSDYQLGDLLVESYSLGRLLNPGAAAKAESDPKAVLTAIDTGLQMLIGNAERRPELKFHPDSSLLFVRGTKAEVQLVNSVIARMTDEAVRRQSITLKRVHAEQIRNLRVKEARLRIQLKEMELGAVMSHAEKVRQQVEAGAMSAAELAPIELEVGRAKMSFQFAQLELERADLSDPEESAQTPGANPEPRDLSPASPAAQHPKADGGKRPK